MSGCWKNLLPLLLLLLQALVPSSCATTVGDTTTSFATGLLLADLFPGEGHSFPSRFQWIHDKLYFRMDFGSDSSHRLCVVLSYGEQEEEVEDPADDLIHHPVSTGALADSASSSELRLHRILLEDPRPSSDLVQFPQPVHFEAWGDDGVLICSHAGLYLYNETDRSVLQLTNTRNLSCSIDFDLVHFQGRVYFAADHAPQNLGTELWATNGTPEGTVLVQDIKQGPTDSNPEGPIVTRDYLFFFADHWLSYTNGTTVERVSTEGIEGGLRLTPNIHTNAQAVANGTILVLPAMTISPQWSTDLWAIDTTSNPFEITRLTPADPDVSVQSASPLDNDRVLFWTQHKSSYKYTLWVSDGTVNGTNPILGELESQLDTPITNRFTPLGNNNKGIAVFAVQRGNTNSQLYRTDGTSKGTYPFYETNAGNLKVRSNWATFGPDKLYFVVADEDQDCTSLYHCSELYVTNGETVQRQPIDWIQGGSSILDSLSYSITDKTPTMHPLGDNMLVFGANDPNLNYGVELWAIQLPEETQVVDPDTATDLTEGSQSTLLQQGEGLLETTAPTPTPGDDSAAEETPTEPTTIDANTEVVVSKVEKSGENVSPSKVNHVSSSATPRVTWCGLSIMTLFLQLLSFY